MRISDAGFWVAVRVLALIGLAVCATSARAQTRVEFVSPEAAYEQGIASYRRGYEEIAIPAFEYAASKGSLLARYHLARIYADNATAYTDHAAAYTLYQSIVSELVDIDPDTDQRASVVAKALTAVAGYLKSGLPEIKLQPNADRAFEYLHHAATFFNDEGAQFELAKIYLEDDATPENVRRGLDWLSKLSQRGNAGAQAQLASEYWRGRHVKRDPLRAFSLIGLAVVSAPVSDRLWIEDIYQNIYCGAPEATRRQAEGMLADWRRKYMRPASETQDRSVLGAIQPRVTRTCANGEPVLPLAADRGAPIDGALVQTPSLQPPATASILPQGVPGGTATGTPVFSLQDAGGRGR